MAPFYPTYSPLPTVTYATRIPHSNTLIHSCLPFLTLLSSLFIIRLKFIHSHHLYFFNFILQLSSISAPSYFFSRFLMPYFDGNQEFILEAILTHYLSLKL